MRRILRWTFRIILGIIVGTLLYEGILLVRVLRLRSNHPDSTSLIDTRASEAEAKGQEPRREQAWVPLDRISPNLQRAVLAGEKKKLVTHNRLVYPAIPSDLGA